MALLMALVRLPTAALLAQLAPAEAEACLGPLLAALTVHRGAPVPLQLVPLHIAALEAIDKPLYDALPTEAPPSHIFPDLPISPHISLYLHISFHSSTTRWPPRRASGSSPPQP